MSTEKAHPIFHTPALYILCTAICKPPPWAIIRDRGTSQVEQKYQTGYIHPARLVVVEIKPVDYRVVKIH